MESTFHCTGVRAHGGGRTAPRMQRERGSPRAQQVGRVFRGGVVSEKHPHPSQGCTRCKKIFTTIEFSITAEIVQRRREGGTAGNNGRTRRKTTSSNSNNTKKGKQKRTHAHRQNRSHRARRLPEQQQTTAQQTTALLIARE